MPEHTVKRGLDIPIAGAATGDPIALDLPARAAYCPTEFPGFVARPEAKEGDIVAVGSPLLRDKTHPEMKLLSPVAGTVVEVRRGPRRVITHVVVEVGGSGEATFPAHALASLKSLSAETARAQLLAGGLWPTLKTRPLSRIARPTGTPQSILVGGHETGPCMPGASSLLSRDDKDALQAGIYVLRALAPKVLLTKGPDPHPVFDGIDGAELHTFRGPHPAGDPATQVNLADPPRGGSQVWYLRAWDAVLIGRLFLSGRFPAERVYAAVGLGCQKPRLVKTVLGAPLEHIVGETAQNELRWIRGSVLTGAAVDPKDFASYYARAVHLLPNAVERELFGWTLPGFGKFSFHKAFPAGLFGSGRRSFDLRPGLWGGERAMIPIGVYSDVIATPDILPEFLFKSILAGDVEESIQLGLLDITEEEAALCTYICPSKIEFDRILREGIERYASEA